MNAKMLKTRPLSLQTFWRLQKYCYATKSKGVLSDIDIEEVPEYDVEPKYTMEEVDKIRNKSRLAPQHRNILNDQAPYDEPKDAYHDVVWFRRKMLGRYGIDAPMANPKYCWPTKEEVEDIKEYERVLYPKTIPEIWKEIEEKKIQDALEIKEREDSIDQTVSHFDKWREVLDAKMKKKEAELAAAKQRKEAMLQEIRDHFGFYIDPRDERFQEMIEQKEKEDRKKKKEEKKKLKKEKMIAFMKQAEAPKAEVKTEAKSTDDKSEEKIERKHSKENSTEDESKKTN